MLEKFKLYYNSEEITTERGLVQGSILSPMLFNLFINNLLIALRIQGIYTLAYADDIAWVWRSLEETHKAIQIMKSWCTENSMKINESKSGILRILQRKVKWKGIKNELNIPGVDSYRYLGVQITQTASIKEHAHVLRKIERYMKRRLCILRPILMNTRNRLIVFKAIIKSKVSYANSIICKHDARYTKTWESILYRLLKILFWIKTNVKKEKIYNIFKIDINNQWNHQTVRRSKKPKENPGLIEYLSIKAIKLKLDCLFFKHSKRKLWKWTETINWDIW